MQQNIVDSQFVAIKHRDEVVDVVKLVLISTIAKNSMRNKTKPAIPPSSKLYYSSGPHLTFLFRTFFCCVWCFVLTTKGAITLLCLTTHSQVNLWECYIYTVLLIARTDPYQVLRGQCRANGRPVLENKDGRKLFSND